MKKVSGKKTQSIGLWLTLLLVQLGDIVTDMRGKSGGNVYSRGRYGLQKRAKVKPRTVYSAEAQEQKGNFSFNSSAWRSLTDAQRAGWRNAAAQFTQSNVFGNSITLTGNALYVRLNNVILSCGGSPISTAPSPASIAGVLAGAAAADVSANTFTLAYTPGTVPANNALQIWATSQKGAGETANQNEFYLLQVEAAAATSPANIFAAYVARFGGLVAGKKVFLRTNFANVLTGQQGIPTMSECTIAA